MKLPEYLNKESSHMTNVMNTMTLTGLSVLWGVMLGLISPWWMIAGTFFLFGGYGSEIRKRNEQRVQL
jgi:hypothetical protein